MLKLAIVDDDPRLLQSLKIQLEKFEEVDSIITANSGLRFAEQLKSIPDDDLPDVVIMDMSMETPDEGVRAASAIKKSFPLIHVIMFTVSDRDDLIFEAFKAGAMGYLLKNETPAYIIKTAIDVKAGDAQMSPGIARKTIHYLTRAVSKPVPVSDDTEELSARELETINLVAKGYTYHQIGDMLNIAPNTAKKHMTNIFAKLHVKNKIEALIKTESYREQHHG